MFSLIICPGLRLGQDNGDKPMNLGTETVGDPTGIAGVGAARRTVRVDIAETVRVASRNGTQPLPIFLALTIQLKPINALLCVKFIPMSLTII